jgi:hypothetical protein
LAGEYVDYDTPPRIKTPIKARFKRLWTEVTGIQPTSEAEEIFLLEFHINLDLLGFEDLDADGEPTGIKLPYVVTMEETGARIVGSPSKLERRRLVKAPQGVFRPLRAD